MTPLAIVWLGIVGGAFLLWAVQMLRCLFTLMREASGAEQRRSGRVFPGARVTLAGFADFVRAPRHRAARRRLLWLTVAVFALQLLRPLFWTLPGAA